MAIEKTILTEKNNVTVYNETTKPKKPKRRDKSDLGPDFVAPDGGWGWVVCLAAGFSNCSMFPALQQYGLIYRERMLSLGFDASKMTTIVNIVLAISSLIGIINGAMFRRFTFRQVALAGSMLTFFGVFLSAFCTTFLQYVICLSCLYGIGLGLSMAATSLAVNTYFKNRRRRATGFSWTITGLGPIIFPHVSTFLLVYYGVQGTILIYAGIALNAVLCSLTLQPVMWHVRKPEKLANAEQTNGEIVNCNTSNNTTTVSVGDDVEYECKYCQYRKRAKRSIFSSQYLFNDDDQETPGYEITEPGTPMLARANDGWFGSKMSLAPEKTPRLRHKLLQQLSIRSRDHDNSYADHEPALYKPNYFNREREDLDHYTSKASVYSKPGLDEFHCTCAEEKALLQKITDEQLKLEQEKLRAAEEAEELAKSKMSLRQKVVKFLDLDLLRDFTFVNLALGMTLMIFGEMNFSVLTPIILNSYGYTNEQISMAMSLLAVMDISVRFFAPFALEKVKLDNRALLAVGIIAISIGRVLVTMATSFEMILGIFLLIGFGKGFRTIFQPLIIPSYVPLKRLPAASGLQLIINGLFTIVFGPILGFITDATSYTMTIHFINLLTSLALLMWLTESIIRRILKKKKSATIDEN